MIYLSVVEVFFPSTGEHCRETVFNRIGGYQKTSVSIFGEGLLPVSEGMSIFAEENPRKTPKKSVLLLILLPHVITTWVFFCLSVC